MKMRKIVAIMAAVLMLCSILPISAIAAEETVTYTISSYDAGTQYKAETHVLDDYMTVYTNTRCYFTDTLRMYAPSGSVAAEVILASTKNMSSVVLNAGNKASTLTVSTSADNSTWTEHSTLSVASSYADLAINDLPADTKYIKLVNGNAQIRIKSFTVTYAADAGGNEPACEHANAVYEHACCETVCPDCDNTLPATADHSYTGVETLTPTCTTAGKMTYTCACGDSYTEAIPAIEHTYVDGVCSSCGSKEPNEAVATIPLIAATGALADDNLSISWTDGTIQFVNYKSASTNAIRTEDTDHFRIYAKNRVVISGKNGETMTKVQITATSSSYANVLVNSGASEGWTVSANGMVVTYVAAAGATELVIESLTAQSRCNSAVITYNKGAGSDEPACVHTNAVACDKTCPDCGVLLHADAACVSNAAYACHEGVCIYCGVAVEPADHQWNEDDVCTVCGQAPTPEKPVDPSNPQEYVFADFAAGEQYAEGEKHYLDNAVTVITTQAHFTTELRIYSSSTHDGNAVIKSKKDISAIVLNAGNKVDVLNVYVSAGGEIYEAVEITATTYNDYIVLIPEMTKYIRLDVAGENQVRVKSMTLYFDGEVPHTHNYVGTVTKEATCTEDGVMTYACECKEGTYTEAIPALGHTYDNNFDADCNDCGAVREVEAPVAQGGTSVYEDNRSLAVRYNMTISGMDISGTVAVYDDATMGGYTLITMGANVNNGRQNKDVTAKYLCALTETSASFAVRVMDIPEDKLDVQITFTPYYIVEIDGVETRFDGDAFITSYDAAAA